MSVPYLKECCQLCIIHHILGDSYGNQKYWQQQQKLLRQLDRGAWGEESLTILNRAVKSHGYFISSEVILALLPNITKTLSLKECPEFTEDCLNAALKRCQHLQTLDLTENPLLKLSSVQLFGCAKGHTQSSLSSVTLEDCSQVKDCHVQMLLRNAPYLQHLNVARCDITDNVFLLDEQKQLAREAGLEINNETSVINSRLQSVDVSRCSEFTSTGVRHLCTLCGPTLQTVNLAWTKVDCTALLYLSGMGLPSAVEFFMTSGVMSEEMMEPLIYNLHQFDAICQDISQKLKDDKLNVATQTNIVTEGQNKDKEVDLSDIHPYLMSTYTNHTDTLEYSSKLSALSVDEKGLNADAITSCQHQSLLENLASDSSSGRRSPTFQLITMDDLLLASPLQIAGYPCKTPHKNQSGASCNICALQSKINGSKSVEMCNLQCPSTGKKSSTEFCDKQSVKPSKSNVNTCESDSTQSCHSDIANDNMAIEERTDSQVVDCDEEDLMSRAMGTTTISESQTEKLCASFVNNSHSVEDKFTHRLDSIGDQSENRQGMMKVGMSENEFFFDSNIISICLTATVFREETLGLHCLQKFLITNPRMSSVTIYSGISGNFLSDNVLDLICTYAHHLESLCVEGSDKLTPSGVIDIGRKCERLTSLDLTGVSFVGDEGIVPLVDSLPLTRIRLAETRITGDCLNHMANLPIVEKLQELDLSWCEEIENTAAVNSVVSSCPSLKRLMLRECCIADTTLMCMAQNPHCITELSLASNMNVMNDDSVVMLMENLPLLESIDLGWNSYLTNISIHALLSNCHFLVRANLEGLKLLTSSPFMPLISVPDELHLYLKEKRENFNQSNLGEDCEFEVNMLELPCLPHRSTTYSTRLKHVNLNYSDFVEDTRLQQIVTVAHGGLEVLDYYGNKVEPLKSSLEKYLAEYVDVRGGHG